MPKIPVSIDQLPTEFEPLDESIPYHVLCRAIEVSNEPDKNGLLYLTGIKLEVVEPEEWRGRNIFVNYIALPEAAGANASLAERRRSEEQGVQLARFIKAFRIPYDAEGFDPQDALGCEGQVTVQTEEYQGRKSSRVKDWLL